MLNISIRESIMVKPTQETPKHTQWFSNLDLLVPRIHIPTVSFYRPNGSPTFFSPSVLKESLGNVLVPFYPLAGRLKFNDINGRLEINCNGEGVLFIEAESDCIVDFIGDFNPSSQLQRLVPSFDYSSDISSYPLAVFQVTYFKCGGVCLGSGLHHTIVDGSAALHFINAWSEIARGVPITIPPFLDRTLLRGRKQPTPLFNHTEYHLPSCTKEPLYPEITTSTATLKVKPGQLDILKAKLQGMEVKMGMGNGPTKKFSTYEAIATHVWHCASAARDLSDDQEMKLYMVVDARSKLDPPLPPGYFGNAIFTSAVVTTPCNLKSQPMWRTTQKIHDVLKRMKDDYLRSAIDYLELQADPMALVRGAHTFGNPNLNVVSWLTLPLSADFGWGKPIHVGPVKVTFEGLAYILRDPTSDGGISVVICLQAQHMKLFKKIFYDF